MAYSRSFGPIEGNSHCEKILDYACVPQRCGHRTDPDGGSSSDAGSTKESLARVLFDPTHVVRQLRIDSGSRSGPPSSHLGSIRYTRNDKHYLDHHNNDCRIGNHHYNRATYVNNYYCATFCRLARNDRPHRILDQYELARFLTGVWRPLHSGDGG